MHELSIADAVYRIAAETAGARRVERVELKVGHLRQVVPSALEFAFMLVTQGTALDGAELSIEEIPARLACRACGAVREVEGFPLACRRCGSLDTEVIAGDELLVDALVLVDENVMTRR